MSSAALKEKRFRFSRFADRLAAIDVDVTHVSEANIVLDESADIHETKFASALVQWRRNGTQDFSELSLELRPLCQSMPALLFHMPKILDILIQYLWKENCQALEPVLDLIAVLAKDALTEFSVHLPRVFGELVKKLDSREPQLLENIFRCFSYIFRFMCKYMIASYEKYLSLYAPLLAHPVGHVRQFAAESWAFLLRKMNDKTALRKIEPLFAVFPERPIDEHARLAEGIGAALFESVRSVQNSFSPARLSGTVAFAVDDIAASCEVEEAEGGMEDQQTQKKRHDTKMTVSVRGARLFAVFSFLLRCRHHCSRTDSPGHSELLPLLRKRHKGIMKSLKSAVLVGTKREAGEIRVLCETAVLFCELWSAWIWHTPRLRGGVEDVLRAAVPPLCQTLSSPELIDAAFHGRKEKGGEDERSLQVPLQHFFLVAFKTLSMLWRGVPRSTAIMHASGEGCGLLDALEGFVSGLETLKGVHVRAEGGNFLRDVLSGAVRALTSPTAVSNFFEIGGNRLARVAAVRAAALHERHEEGLVELKTSEAKVPLRLWRAAASAAQLWALLAVPIEEIGGSGGDQWVSSLIASLDHETGEEWGGLVGGGGGAGGPGWTGVLKEIRDCLTFEQEWAEKHRKDLTRTGGSFLSDSSARCFALLSVLAASLPDARDAAERHQERRRSEEATRERAARAYSVKVRGTDGVPLSRKDRKRLRKEAEKQREEAYDSDDSEEEDEEERGKRDEEMRKEEEEEERKALRGKVPRREKPLMPSSPTRSMPQRQTEGNLTHSSSWVSAHPQEATSCLKAVAGLASQFLALLDGLAATDPPGVNPGGCSEEAQKGAVERRRREMTEVAAVCGKAVRVLFSLALSLVTSSNAPTGHTRSEELIWKALPPPSKSPSPKFGGLAKEVLGYDERARGAGAEESLSLALWVAAAAEACCRHPNQQPLFGALGHAALIAELAPPGLSAFEGISRVLTSGATALRLGPLLVAACASSSSPHRQAAVDLLRRMSSVEAARILIEAPLSSLCVFKDFDGGAPRPADPRHLASALTARRAEDAELESESAAATLTESSGELLTLADDLLNTPNELTFEKAKSQTIQRLGLQLSVCIRIAAPLCSPPPSPSSATGSHSVSGSRGGVPLMVAAAVAVLHAQTTEKFLPLWQASVEALGSVLSPLNSSAENSSENSVSQASLSLLADVERLHVLLLAHATEEVTLRMSLRALAARDEIDEASAQGDGRALKAASAAAVVRTAKRRQQAAMYSEGLREKRRKKQQNALQPSRRSLVEAASASSAAGAGKQKAKKGKGTPSSTEKKPRFETDDSAANEEETEHAAEEEDEYHPGEFSVSPLLLDIDNLSEGAWTSRTQAPDFPSGGSESHARSLLETAVEEATDSDSTDALTRHKWTLKMMAASAASWAERLTSVRKDPGEMPVESVRAAWWGIFFLLRWLSGLLMMDSEGLPGASSDEDLGSLCGKGQLNLGGRGSLPDRIADALRAVTSLGPFKKLVSAMTQQQGGQIRGVDKQNVYPVLGGLDGWNLLELSEGQEAAIGSIASVRKLGALCTRVVEECSHRLMGSSSAKLQELALEVLLKNSHVSSAVAPYQKELSGLCSDREFKHTLLKFSLDPDQGRVDSRHRDVVSPLVIRLLFAKLPGTRGGVAAAQASKRASIFAFFGKLPDVELSLLVSCMLGPLFAVEAESIERSDRDHTTRARVGEFAKDRAFAAFFREHWGKASERALALRGGKEDGHGWGWQVVNEGQSVPKFEWDMGGGFVGSLTISQALAAGAEGAEGDGVRRQVSRLLGFLVALEDVCQQVGSRIFPLSEFLAQILVASLVVVSHHFEERIGTDRAGVSGEEEGEGGDVEMEAAGDTGEGIAHDGSADATGQPEGGDQSGGGETISGNLRKKGKEGSNLRFVLRSALGRLSQLLSSFPANPVWPVVLRPAASTLQTAIERASKTSNTSAALQLVCQWTELPPLFHLFQSILPGALPALFSVPSAGAVLARVTSGLDAGPAAAAAVEAALRLSNGGASDEGETLRTARKYREAKKERRRKRKSLEDDSGAESEEEPESVYPGRVAQSLEEGGGGEDSVLLDEDEEAKWNDLTADLLELDSQAKVRKAMRTRKEAGLRVLLPQVDILLGSVGKLIAGRVRGGRLAAVHQQRKNRGGKKVDTSLVTVPELRLLASVASSCQTRETACRLIPLLCASLPPNPSGNTKIAVDANEAARMQLTLAAIQQIVAALAKTCGETGGFAPSVAPAVRMAEFLDRDTDQTVELSILLDSLVATLWLYLSGTQDLGCRDSLCGTILVVEATLGGVIDPLGLLAESQKKHKDKWRAAFDLETSQSRAWRIASAHLLCALNQLTASVSLQPDFDAHVETLTVLVDLQKHRKIKGKEEKEGKGDALPVGCLDPLVRHCLFALSVAEIDLGVRQVALQALCAVVRRLLSSSDEKQTGVSSYEVESERLCSLLFSVMIPAIRRGIARPEEAVQRSALQFLSFAIRTLGPNISRFEKGEGRERDRLLHCDLLPLLKEVDVIGKGKSESAEAEAEGVLGREDMFGFTPASDEGGDLFGELLHLQRHRKSRALVLLSKAGREGKLEKTTIAHFCFPLATHALLQGRVRKELYDNALAEVAITCLGDCTRGSSWGVALSQVRKLVTYLGKHSAREKPLVRAVCRMVSNFEFKLADAAVTSATPAEGSTAVRSGTAAVGVKHSSADEVMKRVEEADEEGRQEREREEREGDEEDDGGLVRESKEETIEGEGGEDGGEEPGDEGQQGEDEEVKDLADGEGTGRGDRGSDPSSETERIQKSIKTRLVPLLRRLLLDRSTALSPSEEAASKGGKPMGGRGGKSKTKQAEEGGTIRPAVVGVLLQVLRYLPSRQFHGELPKLVRTLCASLRSRDVHHRTAARQALCQVAFSLRPPYLPWLLSELCTQLTKGFQLPVRVAVTHALLRVLFDPDAAGELGGIEGTGGSGGKKKIKSQQHRERLLGKQTETSGEGQPEREGGAGATNDASVCIDRAIPHILPIVLEELDRVNDPDRPEQEGDASGSAKKSSTVPEASKVRGGEIMFLVGCAVTPVAAMRDLVKFLYGLLTGSAYERQDAGASRSAAFSTRFLNRVRELSHRAVLGLEKNPFFAKEPVLKLRLATRLVALSAHLISTAGLRARAAAHQRASQAQVSSGTAGLGFLSTGGAAGASFFEGVQKRRLALLHRLEAEERDFLKTVEGVDEAVASELQEEVLESLPQSFVNAPVVASARDLAGKKGGKAKPEQKDTGNGGDSQASGGRLNPDAPMKSNVYESTVDVGPQSTTISQPRKEQQMLVQPGAATGRGVEQVIRRATGFDPKSRASVIGSAGLRLLLHSLRMHKQRISEDNQRALSSVVDESERGGEGTGEGTADASEDASCMDILESVGSRLVVCFCSDQNELFGWGARCLLWMQPYSVQSLETQSQRIALNVLRILEIASGGSATVVETARARGSSTAANTHRELVPVCTKLLAALLVRPSSSVWFDAAMVKAHHVDEDTIDKDGNWALKGRGTAGGALERFYAKEREEKRVAREKKFKEEATTGKKTFQEALLAQVSTSLDDRRLQDSALHLFRRVILAKQKQEGLTDASAATEMYKIADRVGELLVISSEPQITSLCGNIYVDFVLKFPMTPKVQTLRVAQLVKNLGFKEETGRRSVLNCLHHLVMRCEASVFAERFAGLVFLRLATRLADESDATAKKMLHVLLKAVLAALDEGERGKLIDLLFRWKDKKFALRVALVELGGLLLEFYADAFAAKTNKANNLFSRLVVAVRDCLRTGADASKGEKERGDHLSATVESEVDFFSSPSVPKKKTEKTGGEEGAPARGREEPVGGGLEVPAAEWRLSYAAAKFLEKSCRVGAVSVLDGLVPIGESHPDFLDAIRERAEGSGEGSSGHQSGGELDPECGTAAAELWRYVCVHGTGHSHPWVRVASARAVGLVIGSTDSRRLVSRRGPPLSVVDLRLPSVPAVGLGARHLELWKKKERERDGGYAFLRVLDRQSSAGSGKTEGAPVNDWPIAQLLKGGMTALSSAECEGSLAVAGMLVRTLLGSCLLSLNNSWVMGGWNESDETGAEAEEEAEGLADMEREGGEEQKGGRLASVSAFVTGENEMDGGEDEEKSSEEEEEKGTETNHEEDGGEEEEEGVGEKRRHGSASDEEDEEEYEGGNGHAQIGGGDDDDDDEDDEDEEDEGNEELEELRGADAAAILGPSAEIDLDALSRGPSASGGVEKPSFSVSLLEKTVVEDQGDLEGGEEEEDLDMGNSQLPADTRAMSNTSGVRSLPPEAQSRSSRRTGAGTSLVFFPSARVSTVRAPSEAGGARGEGRVSSSGEYQSGGSTARFDSADCMRLSRVGWVIARLSHAGREFLGRAPDCAGRICTIANFFGALVREIPPSLLLEGGVKKRDSHGSSSAASGASSSPSGDVERNYLYAIMNFSLRAAFLKSEHETAELTGDAANARSLQALTPRKRVALVAHSGQQLLELLEGVFSNAGMGEVYLKTLAAVRMKVAAQKRERKKTRLILAAKDPMLSAQLKERKRVKKKDVKKGKGAKGAKGRGKGGRFT
uniref:Uncharacterized protein n=1 Tax=Chromera velia CCMP2878 TaxID=1169474 RepID=A0A0G4GBF3_9ALVE|eukprot:Cvel_4470.t1-p1 / transcript=Cvel_4470.t1 / gene=Cvel_4470 / organism=Chromera_velia_CCMP2878 / gene_product=Small subunit processome component 20 homolog, putative / transcript_product=Small subunit processome component 20 homolog, putative / location=Cvel_scaffold195:64656-85446(-) / protein_length=4583 / sequence_SO=supercontig / SO=protein_coding / is_pseudo=false